MYKNPKRKILFYLQKNVKEKYLQKKSPDDFHEKCMGKYTNGKVTHKLGRKDPIRERLVTMTPW